MRSELEKIARGMSMARKGRRPMRVANFLKKRGAMTKVSLGLPEEALLPTADNDASVKRQNRRDFTVTVEATNGAARRNT